MSKKWYQYQEEIKDYFQSLGLNAKTNVPIQGIRTTHNIDVCIDFSFIGFDITWLVEAKYWNSKVNKNVVLAFRQILDDIGADKGIIISNIGFQKGAIDTSKNTNVILRTFEQIKKETGDYTKSIIINCYKERFSILEARYYAHSKRIREKYGLKAYLEDLYPNFSGYHMLAKIDKVLNEISLNKYPIDLVVQQRSRIGNDVATNFQQAINWLNLNFNLLDKNILLAEINMQKNGDFLPMLKYPRKTISSTYSLIHEFI